MRLAITLTIMIVVVAATTSVPSHALSGKSGYTATSLLTPSDVKSDVTYPSGVSWIERWQDLTYVEFWAPGGGWGGACGVRDGIAANSSGDLFFLVWGSDYDSGDNPTYTGLIKLDGTNIEHLIQDEMDSHRFPTREGSELQAVVTSPCTSGLLVEGYPVVLRHVLSGQGDDRTFHAEVVMVDPDDGSETHIYTAGVGDWSAGNLAIASDGTIYFGPLWDDGSIARLTYDSGTGAYVEDTVPGTFSAAGALIVGPNDDLYTYADGWWAPTKDERDIYRIVPSTGAASVYASVAGWFNSQDWVLGADGTFWIALDGTRQNYVTEVVAGKTTSSKNRITDSDYAPWSIAAGPDGKIYVLENPFYSTYGEIWLLTQGSGGGGGGKPPKPPKK